MHSKKFLIIGIVLVLCIALLYALTDKPNSPVGGMMSEIVELRGNKLSFKELSVYFTKLAHKKGGAYAFEVLKAVDIPKGTDMHLLAHVVGDILYGQEGVKGIAVCTDDFRNACSHSIVVGTLLERGERSLGLIADTCKKAPGGSGAYTMCFHGLGHGVLAYTDYNMEKATDLCSKLGTEAYRNREFNECVGGMTMEIVSGVHNPAQWEKVKGNYLRAEDPLYPCTADFIPARAKNMCFLYITPHLFEVTGGFLGNLLPEDFKKAFVYCGKITNTADREICYGGFGKEFIGIVKGRDIRRESLVQMDDTQLTTLYDWCLLADNREGSIACMLHAMNSLYWGGENGYRLPLRFCEVIGSQGYRRSCFENLIGAVQYYKKGSFDSKEFCPLLPKEFKEKCQNSSENLPTI